MNYYKIILNLAFFKKELLLPGPAEGIMLSGLPSSVNAKVFLPLIGDGLQREGHILYILPLHQFLSLQLLLTGSQHTTTHMTCTQNNRCPKPKPSKASPTSEVGSHENDLSSQQPVLSGLYGKRSVGSSAFCLNYSLFCPMHICHAFLFKISRGQPTSIHCDKF